MGNLTVDHIENESEVEEDDRGDFILKEKCCEGIKGSESK